MPSSKAERVASGCGLVVSFGFALAIVVTLIVGAIIGTRPSDRGFVIPLVTIGSIAMLAVPAFAISLSRFGKTRGPIRSYVESIARSVSGSVHYPSFRTFAEAPRVETQFEGAPVEIRLLRSGNRAGSHMMATMVETEHARLGTHWLGPTFRIHISIETSSRVRFGCATRARLGAFGASLVGLRVVPNPDPDFERRFVVATDHEAGARSVVDDAALRAALAALLGKCAPFAASLHVGHEQSAFVAIVSEKLGAEAIRDAVAELAAISRVIAASPDRFASVSTR